MSYFGYELEPSPNMENLTEPRQLVLLSFSRLRFRQNLLAFLGMSPCPVVDVTKMTRRACRISDYIHVSFGKGHQSGRCASREMAVREQRNSPV